MGVGPPPPVGATERRLVAAIVAFTVIGAVVTWQATPGFDPPRRQEAARIAMRVAGGHGYTQPPGWYWGPGEVATAHKPPAFVLALVPVLVALPEGGEDVAWVVIEIALLVASAWLAWRVGRRLAGPAAGVVAAAFAALLPSHLLGVGVMSGETMAGVLLLAAAAAWLDRRPVLAGLAAGAAALTVSALLAVVAVALVGLGWRRRREALVAGAVVLACLVPWAVRNQLAVGSATPATTNTGMELWIGNHDGANGGMVTRDGIDLTRLPDDARRVEEVERSRILRDRAVDWIGDHPGPFLTNRRNAFIWFWTSQVLWLPDRDLWVDTATELSALLLLPAVLVGAVLAIARRETWAVVVLVASLALSLPYALTHADIGDRYRQPVDPLLGLVAAWACVEVVRVARGRVDWRGGARAPGRSRSPAVP